MMLPPIDFTDEEMDAITALATPQPPSSRSAFLQIIGDRIPSYPLGARGSGLVHRLACETQRDFLRGGAGSLRRRQLARRRLDTHRSNSSPRRQGGKALHAGLCGRIYADDSLGLAIRRRLQWTCTVRASDSRHGHLRLQCGAALDSTKCFGSASSALERPRPTSFGMRHHQFEGRTPFPRLNPITPSSGDHREQLAGQRDCR